ncbi:MAG: RNA ligase family protein [Bacteroidota bacterium]
MIQIHKYPRTHHIEGSRLQPGDEDLDSMAFEQIKGRYVVIEEKMDGANSGVSFSETGKLQLQSRGHYLSGGPREKHFDLFKTWANVHVQALQEVLGSRYVMYGEWLYAKHTMYYNDLPHYFMEFDVLDTDNGQFLSTHRRQEMLGQLGCVVPVKVLFEGKLTRKEQLSALLTPSFFIRKGHIEELRQRAADMGLRADQVVYETDPSELMEGLYIKVEEAGEVKERYKFVRADFLTTVLHAQSHWLNRPIIPNLLAEGVDIFVP